MGCQLIKLISPLNALTENVLGMACSRLKQNGLFGPQLKKSTVN